MPSWVVLLRHVISVISIVFYTEVLTFPKFWLRGPLVKKKQMIVKDTVIFSLASTVGPPDAISFSWTDAWIVCIRSTTFGVPSGLSTYVYSTHNEQVTGKSYTTRIH